MKKNIFYLAFFISITFSAQNTVGIITNNSGVYEGYTLFAPYPSKNTYLINNCGQVVHKWTSNYTPGASCYLLENGNLLRTAKIPNADITFGGVGGKIELFDWDNTLLWEYTYSNSQVAQHHDISPLPNGNILMLAVTTMTQSEAIIAGRNPALILEGKIYNEQILELEPVGTNQANIVWEWNIKDHLIQDFDTDLGNYGIVADHPELLDFNFLNDNNGNANWLHFNSIQYNANLDQIVISSRLLSEIYIIDHSTSTAQAASHEGGIYGKGGDFLFRWGNPEAYDKGDSTNRTLFSQHYPHWIPEGLVDENKIMIFNNGNEIRHSSLDIISPPMSSPGFYIYDSVNGYGPSIADWTYKAPNPEDFFSSILSSGQRLPNGNILVCDGDSGYFFELDLNMNVVWEYINPDTSNGILSQGDTPISNFVFRAMKFAQDYPAFNGKDLFPPGDPIELNSEANSPCSLLSEKEFNVTDITIYPNPANGIFNIELKSLSNISFDVYDITGKTILNRIDIKTNKSVLNLSNYSEGIYFIKLISEDGTITKKLINY